MNRARVFVDYQNADAKGRIRLICNRTLRDLEGQQIKLAAGMVLTLYEDDEDEHDRPQQIVVDGVVEYSDEEKCWVAVIDWDAIQYVPVARTEAANGTDGSVQPAEPMSATKRHEP